MADLTLLAIKSFKPSSEYQKIKVAKGLFLGITVSGEKYYFVRYSFNGKQIETRLHSISYLNLLEAKQKALEVQSLAKQGINFKDQSTQATITNKLTVKDLFNEWFSTTKRKDGGEQIKRYFDTHIIPTIGSTLLSNLLELQIRNLLKPIADSGTNRKAEMMLEMLKQMFKYGDTRKPWKLLYDNPVINLRSIDIVQLGYKEVLRDRVLSVEEVQELFNKLTPSGLQASTRTILLLCLSCCTRIGETIQAKWEHINLDKGVWHIPESNTKGYSPSHNIYLSDFALDILNQWKQISSNTVWCFPNREGSNHVCIKSPTKQVGDRQASFKNRSKSLKNRSSLPDSLVLSGGEWVPHDLRRTGASLMQPLGVPSHIIDLALNHA
ncbi:MAG: tyrosine-type recombinase/integrase, partial [Silvanigrellaceae bacterium]|nr:tyrosine-type recombinase/integrase [Silvanigrellaceae bacterium]